MRQLRQAQCAGRGAQPDRIQLMPWWGIPAIVGGAIGGLLIAGVAAAMLGARRAEPVDQVGGGPKWQTDRSGDPSRFSRDNALQFNPVPLAVALVAAGAISGLAVGLALS
ncbi:MAG: hypothetical protein ACR2OD_09145 [Gaiellaceae bacterium]